jgi:hypothetical protein
MPTQKADRDKLYEMMEKGVLVEQRVLVKVIICARSLSSRIAAKTF